MIMFSFVHIVEELEEESSLQSQHKSRLRQQ